MKHATRVCYLLTVFTFKLLRFLKKESRGFFTLSSLMMAHVV